MKEEVSIDARDPDIAETIIRWYDREQIFMMQREVNATKGDTFMFSSAAVPDLIRGLMKFMGEIPTQSEIDLAVEAERKRCHDIVMAIDSGRGNEKEIAKAIMAGG